MMKLLLIFLSLLPIALPATAQNAGARRTLEVDGRARTYLFVAPPGAGKTTPLPLVLAFHGAGGAGGGMMNRWGRLAREKGFLLICPDGLGGRWNAGLPEEATATNGADDVKFARALVEATSRDYNVDKSRIYATGFSNGAALSQRLGAQAADIFSAIAPVSANMPRAIAEKFVPSAPVSVLMIIGSRDAMFGDANRWGNRFLTAHETLKKWADFNGCGTAQVTDWPDKEDDGTRIKETRHSRGRGGSEAVLLWIEGGGHVMPGGTQDRRPGTSREVDAPAYIWEYFVAHPKKETP